MRTTLLTIAVVAAALAAPGAGRLAADDLDRQLLEGLEAELLEGIPELRPMPADTPRRSDTPPAGRNTPNLKAAGEDVGPPGEADHPLERVGKRMRVVERRLGAGDASDDVQALQGEIVSDLQSLLEQLRKQCQQGGGQAAERQLARPSARPANGGDQEPGDQASRDPARQSEQGVRETEPVEVEAVDPQSLVREAWGHLPERLREQMQNVGVDDFLPQYRELIEAYFRRLAEEPSGR